MPQNATLGDVPAPPARAEDESLDLSSGIVKKPMEATPNDKVDLSAGLVPRKGKDGKPPTPESEGVWDKLWKGTISPETAEKAITLGQKTPSSDELIQQAAKQRSEGNTWAARASEFQAFNASFVHATAGVISSLTSPGQLALTALTAGEEPLAEAGYKTLAFMARIPGKGAGLWFGLQGLKIAATPQQPGENRYDAFWRRNLGMSAFLGTAYDTMSSARETFSNFLKKQFKLNDDLAGKVATQVQEIDKVRKQTAGSAAKIDAETSAKITALRDSLQDQLRDIRQSSFARVTSIRSQAEQAIEQSRGKLTELQKSRLRQGANTVADTMQAFLQEKARVSKPFDDIAEKIKGEVAQRDEVKDLINKSFADSGVNVDQIPPRAIELLKGKPGENIAVGNTRMKTPDGHYIEVDADKVHWFTEKGYDVVGKVLPAGGIGFDTLTRIREDLGQAAEASKDTRVKSSLFAARDRVTDLQEQIAERHKLGPEYKKAKQGYMSFVRGIGSDQVHTFLDASDQEVQALAPKITMMLKNEENADGLRTVLKAAGIDVKPLDNIISQIKEVRRGIAETKRLANTMASSTMESAGAATRELGKESGQEILEARKSGKKAASETQEQGARRIAEIKKNEVVPGSDVEALQGMTNRQLLEARLRHQMNNAHGGGFVNTWAMTSIIFGLMETVRGSYYGPLLVTKGYMLMKLPEMMKEKPVQDWIIRESGMDPNSPQASRARRGIAALGPVLKKMLKTGIPQAAAVRAAQGLGQPPAAPTR